MHIIFDVGRVLCNVDLKIFTDEFKKIVEPLVDYKLDGLDFLSSIQYLQDAGETSVESSLRDLSSSLNRSLYIDEIEKLTLAWRNTVSPYKQMIDFKNWLIENNHKVAILSNMGREHKLHISEKYPEVFKDCITFFSCSVMYRKPSKIYFYLFLKQHPEFKNAIYFDDLRENLDAGKVLVWFPVA